MIEYMVIYLKHVKDVTSAALPSQSNMGTHDMSWVILVNGAAIDASA